MQKKATVIKTKISCNSKCIYIIRKCYRDQNNNHYAHTKIIIYELIINSYTLMITPLYHRM